MVYSGNGAFIIGLLAMLPVNGELITPLWLLLALAVYGVAATLLSDVLPD